MEMNLSNVSPVQRSAAFDALRRQADPHEGRYFIFTCHPGDNSETEQHAKDGNDPEENDRYQSTDSDESAILSEVTAEELRSPAIAGARVLDSRGENDEYHG